MVCPVVRDMDAGPERLWAKLLVTQHRLVRLLGLVLMSSNRHREETVGRIWSIRTLPFRRVVAAYFISRTTSTTRRPIARGREVAPLYYIRQ